MKNKKIIVAIMVMLYAFSHPSLQAARNEEVSAFEDREENEFSTTENSDIPKAPSADWFAKHRNKLLLVAASIVAIGGGYTLYVRAKRNADPDKNLEEENDPLVQKKKRADLRKEISNLIAEDTAYYKVSKAGIAIDDVSPLIHELTATGAKDTTVSIAKLDAVKHYLSNIEKITDDAYEKVSTLAEAIAKLEWPTSQGNEVGKEIEAEVLTQLSSHNLGNLNLGDSNLEKLIKDTLPKIVQAAIAKSEAALQGANDRSHQDQTGALLSDLYEVGTTLTPQAAIKQLKSGLFQPFITLQHAEKLICKLSDISNSTLPQLQKDYEIVLKEYTELTKEGSAYYKMRDKVGIDLLWKKITTPYNSATYKKAIKAISDFNSYLKDNDLVTLACDKVKRLAQEIALCEWPEKGIYGGTFKGKEIEQAVFTNFIQKANAIPFAPFAQKPANPISFDEFLATCISLADATLKKVDIALQDAKKRTGNDQSNTMLLVDPDKSEQSMSVKDAITQLTLLKSSKPFKVLERGVTVINALSALGYQKGLIQARKNLLESLNLHISLHAEGSVYRKAVAAKINYEEAGPLPSIKELSQHKQELQSMLDDPHTPPYKIKKVEEYINEWNKKLDETAITHLTRRKISKIAQKLDTYCYDNNPVKEPVFNQDISNIGLDDLLTKIIPQMVTAALAKIDVGMKILNEKAGGDQSERLSIAGVQNQVGIVTSVGVQWTMSPTEIPTIGEKKEAILKDKTYTALEDAAALIETIASYINDGY